MRIFSSIEQVRLLFPFPWIHVPLMDLNWKITPPKNLVSYWDTERVNNSRVLQLVWCESRHCIPKWMGWSKRRRETDAIRLKLDDWKLTHKLCASEKRVWLTEPGIKSTTQSWARNPGTRDLELGLGTALNVRRPCNSFCTLRLFIFVFPAIGKNKPH